MIDQVSDGRWMLFIFCVNPAIDCLLHCDRQPPAAKAAARVRTTHVHGQIVCGTSFSLGSKPHFNQREISFSFMSRSVDGQRFPLMSDALKTKFYIHAKTLFVGS